MALHETLLVNIFSGDCVLARVHVLDVIKRSHAFAGKACVVVIVIIRSATVDTIAGYADNCAVSDPVDIVTVYCDIYTIWVLSDCFIRPENDDVIPAYNGFVNKCTTNIK